ncbi:TIGR03086 family metal-binding protein [Streptomonospora nanhaiensis]|uniref:Uncharacterized protein (TIGR03086 family) n=1 Tax=Streptomonospora nanhaiensis TaxID=1323731 RepID=A0A853BSC2_9ACTN|nr:TIGR03086 family metal-binding protein [Streptomonospora nanhaiensis]MBX9387388.1 TIGR03086 family protein [Streptomonospora nanhaiensis]NYI97447.1 uncharacterized protein (TIGR03086 family) [Streptomonospora nanhaiensis]
MTTTTDIGGRYRARAAEFTRRVENVPGDRWDSPSPCAGWSARDVLRHMIDNHRSMPAWGGLEVHLTASVDDDPVGAWHEARDAMQALLDDPAKAAVEYDGYLGRTSVGATVDRFLGIDLVVHAWDLARATGQDEAMPPGDVAWVHETALALGDSLRGEGVCGPALEVGPSASPQDRLLAYLGRRP